MADGKLQQVDTANNIANLLQLIKGKTTTSVSSTNISAAGLNNLIRQQLEGVQGLAAVSAGQKSAGLYNSTTRQLLTNDLLSRTAGEAASRSSTQTNYTKQNPSLSGKDLLTLIALDQAKKRGGPALDSIGGILGDAWDSATSGYTVDTAGQGIADMGAGNLGAQAIEGAVTSSLGDTVASSAADSSWESMFNSIIGI